MVIHLISTLHLMVGVSLHIVDPDLIYAIASRYARVQKHVGQHIMVQRSPQQHPVSVTPLAFLIAGTMTQHE